MRSTEPKTLYWDCVGEDGTGNIYAVKQARAVMTNLVARAEMNKDDVEDRRICKAVEGVRALKLLDED